LQTSFAVLGPFMPTIVSGFSKSVCTHPMPLFIFLKRFDLSSFTGLVVHSIVWVDEHLYLKGHLKACLGKPFFWGMKHIPPHAFLQLYRATDLFQQYGTMHLLTARIANSFKVRFGFSLTKKPTLSVPFCQEVDWKSAKKLLLRTLQQLPLHTDVINWLVSTAMIVSSRCTTFGESDFES
jgi:hypothetical protein